MIYKSLDVGISYFYQQYLEKKDNELKFEINDDVYLASLEGITNDLKLYKWNQDPLTIEFDFTGSSIGSYEDTDILCNGLSELKLHPQSEIKLIFKHSGLRFEGAMRVISFCKELPNINLWIDLRELYGIRSKLIPYVKQAMKANTEEYVTKDVVTIHKDSVTVLCSPEDNLIRCEGDTYEPDNHI